MTQKAKRNGCQLAIGYSDGPARCFGKVLYKDKVSSRLTLKNDVIKALLDIASREGLIAEREKGRWRLCLDEALVNAIVHGNNGDPRRFVKVTLMAGNSRWAVLIEDEGEGFDPEDIPETGSLRSLYAESGRGILLMREFTDELRYYRRGASVMLVKSMTGATGKRKPVKGKPDGPKGS